MYTEVGRYQGRSWWDIIFRFSHVSFCANLPWDVPARCRKFAKNLCPATRVSYKHCVCASSSFPYLSFCDLPVSSQLEFGTFATNYVIALDWWDIIANRGTIMFSKHALHRLPLGLVQQNCFQSPSHWQWGIYWLLTFIRSCLARPFLLLIRQKLQAIWPDHFQYVFIRLSPSQPWEQRTKGSTTQAANSWYQGLASSFCCDKDFFEWKTYITRDACGYQLFQHLRFEGPQLASLQLRDWPKTFGSSEATYHALSCPAILSRVQSQIRDQLSWHAR